MANLPDKSQFTNQSITQDQFKTAFNLLIDYLTGYTPFPSGTRMIFQQSSAPTGWTKDNSATLDNSAMRIVTGSASTGGSDGFSVLFGASKSTAGYALQVADMPAHAHGVNDPTHAHSYNESPYGSDQRAGGSTNIPSPVGSTTGYSATNISIQSTGGGGAHSHVLNNMNLKFVDHIIASKD